MAIKRYLTTFGIPVPPWKEEKLGAGSVTIRFVITGTVPSKKNHQQAVAIRRDARKWAKEQAKIRPIPTWDDVQKAIGMVTAKMMANVAYNEFLERVRPVIHAQKDEWMRRLGSKGLQFPLYKSAMGIRLYFKGRYVTDTVNKQQTIQDILVDCGVIADDDYKRVNPIKSASACYYEEIIENIAFVTLSFRFDKKQENA